MTPNLIISRAAAVAGDPHFTLVLREEHVQYLNEAAHDLWSESKAMHALRQYLLPPDANFFDIPDTDIISFLLVQVLVATDKVEEAEILLTYDPTKNPSTMEQRGTLNALEEGMGIWTDLGNLYDSAHFSLQQMNNKLRLTTPTAFGADRVLQVYAVVTGPEFTWLVGEEALADASKHVWNPIANYFLEACTWRAARELHRINGLPSALRVWQASEQRAERLLRKAVHMIHSLRDEGAAHHIRPFFMLSGMDDL